MNEAQSILDIAIWLPIPFAFFVLGLMVLLRGENRFAGMLLPFVLVTIGCVLYVPLCSTSKRLSRRTPTKTSCCVVPASRSPTW